MIVWPTLSVREDAGATGVELRVWDHGGVRKLSLGLALCRCCKTISLRNGYKNNN